MRWAWISVFLLGPGCLQRIEPEPPPPPATGAWQVHQNISRAVRGFATDGTTVWLNTANGLEARDLEGARDNVPQATLPDGTIGWIGATPAGTLLAWVDGAGLHRLGDDGETWAAAQSWPVPLTVSILNDTYTPLPLAIGGDAASPDTAWIASAGGLYRTEDDGLNWEIVGISPTAGFNILYTDVEVNGDTVVATAFAPAGLLPDAYSGLLTGTVFLSEDGGST